MITRRLKIFCLILMAFVATPRAWQQVRTLARNAEQSIEVQWWGLLLSFQTPETKDADAPLLSCPLADNAVMASNRIPALSPTTRHSSSSSSSAGASMTTTRGQSAPANLPTEFEFIAANHPGSSAPDAEDFEELESPSVRIMPTSFEFAQPEDASLQEHILARQAEKARELERRAEAQPSVRATPAPAPHSGVKKSVEPAPENLPLILEKGLNERLKAEKQIEAYKMILPKLRLLINRKRPNVSIASLNSREQPMMKDSQPASML